MCSNILDISLRITLPILILSFTNIRILILIKVDGKKIYNVLPHEHHQVAHGLRYFLSIKLHLIHCQHRVYTLLAIVLLFILCNILPAFLIVWDMVNFNRVTACQDFNAANSIGYRNFGYTTANLILTDVGNWKCTFNFDSFLREPF